MSERLLCEACTATSEDYSLTHCGDGCGFHYCDDCWILHLCGAIPGKKDGAR